MKEVKSTNKVKNVYKSGTWDIIWLLILNKTMSCAILNNGLRQAKENVLKLSNYFD